MAVAANINLYVTGSQTNPLDLGTATFPFSLSDELALTNGTGANQADRVFTDTRTLGASGTENLDLAGSLTDAYGATLTFVTVKAIIIKALSTNTNDVQVTRPAANGFLLFTAVSAGVANLKPGGFFAWASGGTGVTVTAGTGDLLTITNSAGGTSVDYQIIIIGTSA